MKLPLLKCLVLGILVPGTLGFGLDFGANSEENELGDVEEGRIIPIFLPSTANGLNLNVTILAALIAALAASLMSLFTLVGLGLLAAFNMNNQNQFHHHYATSHHDHGHGGGSYRKIFDSLNFDWETFSIVDFLSFAQEVWNTFDPTDVECQKRFICEVHQNTRVLGPVAEMIAYYFSYLKYLEVFDLPEELKSPLGEYLDAAERGITLKKDCGAMFEECTFSVTGAIGKYGPREPRRELKKSPDMNS